MIEIKHNEKKILFKNKIIKSTVKRKTKTKGILNNTFYSCSVPHAIKNYLGLKDEVYLHYTGGKILLSNSTGKRYTIKNNNLMIIPKKFFNPENFEEVLFEVDLNKSVPCVTMCLI